MYNEKILEKLKELKACQDCIDWYIQHDKETLLEILELADTRDLVKYFKWFISHALNLKNKRKYAVYAAELVLPVWEKEFPNNNIPRLAIEAAKAVIENPTEKNKLVAMETMGAVCIARDAAWCDWKHRASESANVISCACEIATLDITEAASASQDTSDISWVASTTIGMDATSTMKQIITYGLQLLKEQGVE